MIFCENCGKAYDRKINYCSSCGQKMNGKIKNASYSKEAPEDIKKSSRIVPKSYFGLYKAALIDNFNNFDGHADNREFWSFMIINFFVAIGLAMVHHLFFVTYAVLVFIPTITVGVRRINDFLYTKYSKKHNVYMTTGLWLGILSFFFGSIGLIPLGAVISSTIGLIKKDSLNDDEKKWPGIVGLILGLFYLVST